MIHPVYEIHPRIGLARLGNSPAEFYLAPETVGGLPIACDANGNERCDNDEKAEKVRKFKDPVGRVLRQAARFRLYRRDGDSVEEVTLAKGDITKITWTLHIANKKPIWYTFSELQGCLDFGESNSYEKQHVPLNNPNISGDARKKLMIDPGPRSIDKPGSVTQISRYNIPSDYPYGSFPPLDAGGQTIDMLGELRMDEEGRLIALPGLGNVTGSAQITSFRGAAGYWDDIADGFVLAKIHFRDGCVVDAEPAWLLVGSPKYAPELVNITTLYDTMFDTAVRNLGAAPEIYNGNLATASSFPHHNGYTPLAGYNPNYRVDFETQIKPIIERLQSYRWVADIPYLADFAHPGFDMSDARESNRENRMRYFEMFRVPLQAKDYDQWKNRFPNGPNDLFHLGTGMPLMPLNSGDNSVTNKGPIYKFETLSPTQYFFLYQWAVGKFDAQETPPLPEWEQLDRAGVGNCVGAPFSPGIETTWITRSPALYQGVAHLKLAHDSAGITQMQKFYNENGLSTTENEAYGQGLEPGDLTKRMAIPWQADFSECTVQTPNISDPTVNQFADGTGIEVPPTYYVYWWPPQSPMHVMTGSTDPNNQVLDAVLSQIAGQPVIPAGQRVPYQRGIASAADVIANWSRLGFVLNQGSAEYPYFVEVERNNQAIVQGKIAGGEALKLPLG